MKKLKLKLNHILFWWYYRLVDDHFKQYPVIKSIKLLRQHYEHEVEWHNGTRKVLKTASEEIDRYRKDLYNIKMNQIANPGTIDVLNRAFGANINPPDSN